MAFIQLMISLLLPRKSKKVKYKDISIWFILTAIIDCTLLCFMIMELLHFLRAAAQMQDQSVYFSFFINEKEKTVSFYIFCISTPYYQWLIVHEIPLLSIHTSYKHILKIKSNNHFYVIWRRPLQIKKSFWLNFCKKYVTFLFQIESRIVGNWINFLNSWKYTWTKSEFGFEQTKFTWFYKIFFPLESKLHWCNLKKIISSFRLFTTKECKVFSTLW